MKFLASLLFVTSGIALISGCAKPSYLVAPANSETVRKKLDAEWFTRDIYDGTGLAAVELTYCPIQPNTQMVCRTGVVWVRDTSALIDEEPSTGGAPPLAVPAAAPLVAQ
jgi:hypothetical protein